MRLVGFARPDARNVLNSGGLVSGVTLPHTALPMQDHKGTQPGARL
jgi:hypothetical protein